MGAVQRMTKPLPTTIEWQEFYRQTDGPTGKNNTVSSDSHLEIGHQCSDQCHFGEFKYSLSSVPGSLCSHFLEVSSWNCGRICHGLGKAEEPEIKLTTFTGS